MNPHKRKKIAFIKAMTEKAVEKPAEAIAEPVVIAETPVVVEPVVEAPVVTEPVVEVPAQTLVVNKKKKTTV